MSAVADCCALANELERRSSLLAASYWSIENRGRQIIKSFIGSAFQQHCRCFRDFILQSCGEGESPSIKSLLLFASICLSCRDQRCSSLEHDHPRHPHFPPSETGSERLFFNKFQCFSALPLFLLFHPTKLLQSLLLQTYPVTQVYL